MQKRRGRNTDLLIGGTLRKAACCVWSESGGGQKGIWSDRGQGGLPGWC